MTREQAIAYAKLKAAGFVGNGYPNFDNMKRFDDNQRGYVWRDGNGGRVVSLTVLDNGNFLVKAFKYENDWNAAKTPAYQEEFTSLNDAADKVNAHLMGSSVDPNKLDGRNIEVLPNREPDTGGDGENGDGGTPPAPSAPNAPAGEGAPLAAEEVAPELPANWDVDWVKNNAKEIKVTTNKIYNLVIINLH
jgi:hypothetical protein